MADLSESASPIVPPQAPDASARLHRKLVAYLILLCLLDIANSIDVERRFSGSMQKDCMSDAVFDIGYAFSISIPGVRGPCNFAVAKVAS